MTCMITSVQFVLVILFANYCSPSVVSGGEDTHDPSKPKEVNYKKFIGERQYMVPFKTRISQSFLNGQTIHMVGMVKPEPKRVNVNFHRGNNKDSDLPLHLSIRFEEGKMVYNIFENGTWGTKEQRIKNTFKPNSEMDLRLRVLNGKYQVFANLVEIGSFDQRASLDGIDHVSIDGDLVDLRLFHYGGRVFNLPYTALARLAPGKRLDISMLSTGPRFNVNLYHADRQYALQLSVRFNEGVAVRNAMENNEWGKEEREGELPISKGEIVDVTIVNEPYSYQIFFNGKRFASFAHRGTPTDIEVVEIDGDAEIHSVTVNNAVGI